MKILINLFLASLCFSMLQAESSGEETLPAKTSQVELKIGEQTWRFNVSGQINMGILALDDGENSSQHGQNILFVTNDSSPSNIHFNAYNEYTSDLILGANVEYECQANSSLFVSQDDPSYYDPHLSEKILEFYFNSTKYGKISFGRGPSSCYGASEMDYSGTELVSTSGSYHTSGGLKFRDENNSKEFSDTRINSAFYNFNCGYNYIRLRYDAPLFYGYEASASFIEGSRWDLGLHKDFDPVLGVKSKASLAHAHSRSITSTPFHQFTGSIAFLHEETGLNLSLSGGTRNINDAPNTPHYYYTKLGLLQKHFQCGSTAISIDHYHGKEFNSKKSHSRANTLGIVQKVDNMNADFYFNTSLHKFNDQTDVKYNNILSAIIGARIYFP